jgi:hypothetical protein
MANNIGYKASIDVDWVTFKEQSGVIISDSGKTLETTNVIPSNLKLIVSENKGKTTRTATITFTQEGGESGETKTVTLTQNANKAGTYQDGKPYLDNNKSRVVIENKSGITELDISGGTTNFTATYKRIYSVNMYEMDADGNVIRRYVEDYRPLNPKDPVLNSEIDVTSVSACTWTVLPKGLNNSNIKDGKLTVGENTSNSSPSFEVKAIYDGLTSNTLTVKQKVSWTYTVKTNNSGTTVYFLSGGSEVYHEVAELKDDAYYSTYSTNSVEPPKISAYIAKENMYASPKINLYEKGTETKLKEDKWNASASGDSMELDAVYEVSKTTYKVDNDVSSPKTLTSGEINTINSDIDKTENIKIRANDTKSKSKWLKLNTEGDGTENFTFGITAEATNTSRDDGYINFKYIDDKNEIPSAETKFNVSQQVL